MSIDFANFITALMLLASAVCAVQEASHFSRVYRLFPGLLAASCCMLMADRGMDVFNVEISSTVFVIRPYIIPTVRFLAAATIISLIVSHKFSRKGKIVPMELECKK